MVLDGLVSVLEAREDCDVSNAAERAADFLVGDLNEAGLFRTNGAFVSADATKIYNVLCAWAMYRFGKLSGAAGYKDAAIRAVEGALKFQQENGWFARQLPEQSPKAADAYHRLHGPGHPGSGRRGRS